jgi:hypothetical protein
MAINVTRFFRKYNKAMLAVFTVFLMVAFLLPTTLNQLFKADPGNRVLGTMHGKEIKIGNLQRLNLQTEALDAINRSLYNPENPRQSQGFPWEYFVQMGPENQRLLNYYLLIQEARKMGIFISPDQADKALADRKIPPELINGILSNMQIPLSALREAIANFLAVESAFELAASSVKVSDPELEFLFKLTSDKVKVDILPVPAVTFVKDIPQPSDKDLAAYFAVNQSKFRYPDRIQAEYLVADLSQIKDSITVSKERAREYWEEHKSEFTKTVTPPTPAKKGTSTAPAAKPAPVQVVLTFEEALPQVQEKVKMERARDLAKKTMYEAKEEADKFWRSAPTDKSGVKQKPSKVADFQQLADRFSKQGHIKIVYNRTPLMTQEEAGQLPGIGTSFIPEGRRPLYFGEYAFRVVPFIQPPAAKANTQPLFLVQYQNNTGLLRNMTREGEDTGYYLFRVIKTDPSHLPVNLTEIKDQVAQDYRLNQGFVVAKKDADKVIQAAGKQTLSELVKSPSSEVKKIIKQLAVKALEPQTFARQTFSYGGRMVPPTIASVQGNTGKFANTVFEKLWKQPTTQPDGKRTCTVITDDGARVAYVVQFLEKIPATTEEFKQFKTFPAYFLLRMKQQQFAQSWFSPDNIHQRTGFVSKVTEEEMP